MTGETEHCVKARHDERIGNVRALTQIHKEYRDGVDQPERTWPMSRAKVISVLNRLLSIQRISLVNNVNEATAWTHPGNEALAEVTRIIVENHEHYSQRLTAAIEDRHGGVDSTLPMRFTSLKDLDRESLMAKLIENQRRNILVYERCVAKLVEDPRAWSLATEVLGSERAHLDMLREFRPRGKPISNGNKDYSQVA